MSSFSTPRLPRPPVLTPRVRGIDPVTPSRAQPHQSPGEAEGNPGVLLRASGRRQGVRGPQQPGCEQGAWGKVDLSLSATLVPIKVVPGAGWRLSGSREDSGLLFQMSRAAPARGKMDEGEGLAQGPLHPAALSSPKLPLLHGL